LLACFSAAASAIGMCIGLVTHAVSEGGSRRVESANNLKKLGLALVEYAKDHGRFPPP
jgi:hypothetical protein